MPTNLFLRQNYYTYNSTQNLAHKIFFFLLHYSHLTAFISSSSLHFGFLSFTIVFRDFYHENHFVGDRRNILKAKMALPKVGRTVWFEKTLVPPIVTV